jgi:hypothetical protein
MKKILATRFHDIMRMLVWKHLLREKRWKLLKIDKKINTGKLNKYCKGPTE